MRALLASPLGFLIGLLLGALGGGGSILAVPVLVFAAGQAPREATASSLLLVGVAALAGIGVHWRAGRVHLGTGVVFGLVGIGGSIAGSALNRRMDDDLLLLLFSGLVLLAAWRMLVGCPTCTRAGERRVLLQRADETGADGGVATLARVRVDTARVLTVVAAGTFIGFTTGLFGVGGGFVVVPALTLLLHLSMPEAIGTSLVVITINATTALATRMATTSIDWGVTLPFAVAAVGGVVAGSRIADRINAQRSLQWFAGLLVAVAVYTAARASSGL